MSHQDDQNQASPSAGQQGHADQRLHHAEPGTSRAGETKATVASTGAAAERSLHAALPVGQCR